MDGFKPTVEMEMDINTISKEYSEKLNHMYLWPLKLVGYLRFEIRDGHFVEKLPSTIKRSVFFVILGIVSAAYLLFVLAYKERYLTLTEILTVVSLSTVQTCTLVNIALLNKNSGIRLITTCIYIDLVLGAMETKFMRDVVAKTFVVITIFIAFVEIIIIILITFAHLDLVVSDMSHIVGLIYFYLIFLAFFDLCFLVAFHNFLTMRIHYLNVALIKLAKLNPSYFANQFYFNRILWKNSFESLVTFHERADTIQFIKVFVTIFEQLRRLEKCFRFTMFMSIATLILGSFLGVQTIIIHKELPGINTWRTIAIIGWPILSWIYLFNLTQPIDMFYRQIEKTKLICTFIQLKPIMPMKVLKLTKGVLLALHVYNPRVSVYGMFHVSTSLVLKMAASLFVFITVQLQLADPSNDTPANVTAPTDTSVFLLLH